MSAHISFYKKLIPRDSLVFDIGANVGNYSLLFQRSGATVIAVEPQAKLVDKIRDRFKQNFQFHVVHAAVGSAPSTATLRKTPNLTEIASLHPDISARSRFSAQHTYSEFETVPVVTLDQLIESYGEPFFCKIDVEGYEREVLKGLTRPLRLISFEFNREFWPEINECIDLVEQRGRYLFNFTPGTNPVFLKQEWMSAQALKLNLNSSPDPLLWGDIYARHSDV